MIKHEDQQKSVINENMRGGTGSVILKHLLDKEEMNGKGRLFSRIALKKGCSIGYHKHEGESEIFAVVAGKGIFNDNGTEYPVSAGDVLITPSGSGHAIACDGDETLELIALILYA
jgi:quercetin dioxygenase-like cupin family protein